MWIRLLDRVGMQSGIPTADVVVMQPGIPAQRKSPGGEARMENLAKK